MCDDARVPPQAGVLLAIPLDGKPYNAPNPKRLYGVIWILASNPDFAVIATTRWVGTERQISTALEDRRSRQIAARWRLRKNTLAWRISSPPGSPFLGIVAPPHDESKAPSKPGDWDVIRAAFSELAGGEAPSKPSSRHKTTLAKLRRRAWFTSWRGEVPAPTIRAARAILSDAMDALSALKSPAPSERALTPLKRAMRAMNALERREEFIATIEAEDVVEALKSIAEAVGIDEKTFDAKIDVLRDF